MKFWKLYNVMILSLSIFYSALMRKHCLLKYFRKSITLYVRLHRVVISTGQYYAINSSQARMTATLYGDLLREGCFSGHRKKHSCQKTTISLEDFNCKKNYTSLASPLHNCITLCLYVSLWTKHWFHQPLVRLKSIIFLSKQVKGGIK